MKRNYNISTRSELRKVSSIPSLDLKKIGIVARDYRDKFPNGYRDFSYALPSVLKLLDNKGCDSVLFSLFSIDARKGYSPIASFKGLKNIKAIFLEKFKDGENRVPGVYVVYCRARSGWKAYELKQAFGTLNKLRREDIDGFDRSKGKNVEEIFMRNFVSDELTRRIFGNCCVLLCGETNGVKYSKSDKKIHDTFGLRKAIPNKVTVILNPVHDRMTRFEMKLKRKFISKNNRWVISVWNKGKQDKNGKVKDGQGPAWAAYYDGKEIEVEKLPHNTTNVEVGILDLT